MTDHARRNRAAALLSVASNALLTAVKLGLPPHGHPFDYADLSDRNAAVYQDGRLVAGAI